MSELNFRDFFGNGGKKTLPPIYVDNRNDPRIRKYQDSLNSTKNYTYFPFGEEIFSKENPITKKRLNEYISNIGLSIGDKFVEKNPYPNILPLDYMDGMRNGSKRKFGYETALVYKKPVQPIVYKKPTPPKNTNFTVPNNGGYSTPDDYVEPVIEQNVPIQEVPVKQDFRQYMQPRGFSRQGQSGERQSESFYDANGKMTGQIINGQYAPTEYGKFLQSGMTEDEYLNSVQEFGKGGEFNKGGKYSNPSTYSAYEQKYNLPSGLLYNVARTESAFDDDVIYGRRNSTEGAKGLMQFMDSTAREFGINPLNPDQSIDAAGKYLSQLIKQTGNIEDALRAYNGGIGNVLKYRKTGKWGKNNGAMPLETQQYAGKVLGGKSTPSIGGGLGKYFNQIEQDLSWRSRQIDQELEDEEIPQYSQEEAVADNVEEDEDVETEGQPQMVQDEYIPLQELSKLMTASRRNDFLDIVFANAAPSIDEDDYQYYG